MSYLDKTIYVYKGNHDIDQDIKEFHKWLEGEIAKIPEEYLSTARISITTHSCGSYNDYESCIEICYVCSKTAGEIAKEEKQLKYRRQQEIRDLEARLAELKIREEKSK